MRFRITNHRANLIKFWENVFSKERSLVKKIIVAIAIALISFGLIDILYSFTGLFFSGVIQISVILIVFYSGFGIGLFFAIVQSLAADFFFTPPFGSLFATFADTERFVIIILIAIFVATLAATIKSAFQKVALARQQAEYATSMMEKVLALVVHDIRNPLTTIKMGAQIILKTPEQIEKHQKILNRMIESIDHADSIIKTLLDTATIKAGKDISLIFQNCDLNGQVSQMIEKMSLVFSDRLRFIPGGPAFGDWGINGIQRALENLITNAIKYGGAEAPIVVKLLSEGPQVMLSVHNEGKEISPVDQSKLFDIFQRTHDSENSSIRGWGLGLSLVKSVAEAHGGTVLVESSKDKGTTFTLKLPIRNQSQKPQQM